MSLTFTELEQENARLRAAISDCNTGLNAMAAKIVVVGSLLGFRAEESASQIRIVVLSKLEEAIRAEARANAHAHVNAQLHIRINDLVSEVAALRVENNELRGLPL